MRDLADLLSPDPAWPLVLSWVREARHQVEVLPVERARAEDVLVALQVTTRSPMGALALETGGLLVGGGWLRILGGTDYATSMPELVEELPRGKTLALF
jgi:hypothetical protein